MRLGIMQPYFFPYIGIFQLLNYVDTYVLYDDVNYIRRGWINRNNILINRASGRITLSLKDVSIFRRINEIEIDENPHNRKNIVESVFFAYKRAPFFDSVAPIIQNIIYNPEKNLSIYLYHGYKQLCNYLDIKAKIILSSSIEKDNTLRGQDKIIDICHKLQASEYVNAIGGQKLYNSRDFQKSNIQLRFLQTGSIVYTQFNNQFVENLSIIDVLMFNSTQDIKKMLRMFTLV